MTFCEEALECLLDTGLRTSTADNLGVARVTLSCRRWYRLYTSLRWSIREAWAALLDLLADEAYERHQQQAVGQDLDFAYWGEHGWEAGRKRSMEQQPPETHHAAVQAVQGLAAASSGQEQQQPETHHAAASSAKVLTTESLRKLQDRLSKARKEIKKYTKALQE